MQPVPRPSLPETCPLQNLHPETHCSWQSGTNCAPTCPRAAGGNYDLGGGVKGAALGGPARRPALCRPGTRCPPQRHPGSECRPGQAPGLNCREPAKEAKPEFLDKAFPRPWLGTRACNSKRLGFDSRLRIKSTTRGQKPTGPVPPAPGPQPTARLGPCVGTDDSRCSAAARGPGRRLRTRAPHTKGRRGCDVACAAQTTFAECLWKRRCAYAEVLAWITSECQT